MTSSSSTTLKTDKEFVGALDCGTTSVRFIIFDEYANIIAEHQLEFPQYYPHPGWHEHDPEEIFDTAVACISEAVKLLESDKNAEGKGYARSCIKAIGITNQRETTVAWSKKTGRSLCRAIVWTDSRNKGEVGHYERKLKEEGITLDDGKHYKGEEAVKALADLTGLKLSTYFSGIKLHWMIKNYPKVREAHDADDLAFGTVDSWIVYKLTGGPSSGLHIIDSTNASRTLLLNLRTLSWSPSLLSFFSLNSSVLPRVVSSSEVYGHIASHYSPSHSSSSSPNSASDNNNEERKAEMPLAGTPISSLIGDQQSALVGNKCFQKGEAKNTYGTGAFLLFNTGEGSGNVVRSENGLVSTVAYQVGPDRCWYALEGSIGVAGSAVKWLRDSMHLISSASEINTLAAQEKDSGGVTFVTAFSGLLAPYWDTSAGGMIIGLTQYTNPSHIARATLEAVAYSTRAVIEAMKADSGVELKHLKVDGGMTNGDLVMQIQADLGGFEVVRPEMRESTALGAALLAASAISLFGWDVLRPEETLSKVNTKGSRTFKPEMAESEREVGWKRWNRAVVKSRGWEDVLEED